MGKNHLKPYNNLAIEIIPSSDGEGFLLQNGTKVSRIEVGNAVRRVREAKKLNQHMCGIGSKTLQKLELGEPVSGKSIATVFRKLSINITSIDKLLEVAQLLTSAKPLESDKTPHLTAEQGLPPSPETQMDPESVKQIRKEHDRMD